MLKIVTKDILTRFKKAGFLNVTHQNKKKYQVNEWIWPWIGTIALSSILFVAHGYSQESALPHLAHQIVLEPGSKLWLTGDSTVHAYSSTATEIKFDMTIPQEKKSTGNALYEEIRAEKVKTLNVSISVTGLKSGKARLDRNMYKALKAEQHPEIVFHLRSYTVWSSTSDTSFFLVAQGELSIAGQTKPIELQTNVTSKKSLATGGLVQIEGNKELLMTDYGIKPPSFMGAIKTHDQVVINFDLLLSKNSNK